MSSACRGRLRRKRCFRSSRISTTTSTVSGCFGARSFPTIRHGTRLNLPFQQSSKYNPSCFWSRPIKARSSAQSWRATTAIGGGSMPWLCFNHISGKALERLSSARPKLVFAQWAAQRSICRFVRRTSQLLVSTDLLDTKSNSASAWENACKNSARSASRSLPPGSPLRGAGGSTPVPTRVPTRVLTLGLLLPPTGKAINLMTLVSSARGRYGAAILQLVRRRFGGTRRG